MIKIWKRITFSNCIRSICHLLGIIEEYKILQVGESHYIEQHVTDVPLEYDLAYFKNNWWNDPCTILTNKYPWQFNTREVIGGIQKGKKKFYSIFANFASAVQEGLAITGDKRDVLNYIAFTDLYFMPSLFMGMSIKKSVSIAAKREGLIAGKELDDIEKKSSEILDQVIEVLKPKAIFITSKAASDVFKKYSRFKSDPRVFYAYHPGCAWWNIS